MWAFTNALVEIMAYGEFRSSIPTHGAVERGTPGVHVNNPNPEL